MLEGKFSHSKGFMQKRTYKKNFYFSKTLLILQFTHNVFFQISTIIVYTGDHELLNTKIKLIMIIWIKWTIRYEPQVLLGSINVKVAYLFLQEVCPHSDLVLLESTGVAGTLGSHVVFAAPGPILVVFHLHRYKLQSITRLLSIIFQSKVDGTLNIVNIIIIVIFHSNRIVLTIELHSIYNKITYATLQVYSICNIFKCSIIQ